MAAYYFYVGKADVIELETLACLEGSGEVLCMNRSVWVLKHLSSLA